MKTAFWLACVLGLSLLAYELVWPKGQSTDSSLLAAGMPPQIDLIEDIASENGWTIDCRGRSDEMTVVRLAPGWWPAKGSHQDMDRSLRSVASSVVPAADHRSAKGGCDLPTDHVSLPIDGTEKSILFAVGPQDVLARYLRIARECGVEGARVGPATAEQQMALAGASAQDWAGLFLDFTIERRAGPLTCMNIMSLIARAELQDR